MVNSCKLNNEPSQVITIFMGANNFPSPVMIVGYGKCRWAKVAQGSSENLWVSRASNTRPSRGRLRSPRVRASGFAGGNLADPEKNHWIFMGIYGEYSMYTYVNWLVVYHGIPTPLKNDGFRQLGL